MFNRIKKKEVLREKQHLYLSYLYRYIFMVVFLFSFISSSIYANSEITLQSNISSYENFQMELFRKDSKKILAIDKIVNIPFLEKISNAFTFGYSNDHFWFHFSVYNDVDEKKEIIVEMTEAFHDTVNLYTLSSTGTMIQSKNGLDVPIKDRDIQESNPSFMLEFLPFEKKDIYVKLYTTHSVFGSLILKTPKQFYQDNHFKNSIYFFFLGILSIMALYNFFIFLFTREKVYAYYVGYLLAILVWTVNYKGILLPYISMDLNNALQISMPIILMILILFSQAILETKKYFIRPHKVLNILLYLLVINFIWILFDKYMGLLFFNIFTMPILFTMLIITFMATFKRLKTAKIYLFGISIFTIGMAIFIKLSFALSPYTVMLSYIPILALFLASIIFTLILTYHISFIHKNALELEQKLTEQKDTESSRLFHTIAEKTTHLSSVKERLESELEKKEALEKDLKIQALTDPLSGLMNRRSFMDVCLKTIQHKTKLSYLIIDIDKFKNVNDTYGHPFGDKVIKSIAEKIVENTRSSDYIARVGGEEFAILMPSTDTKTAFHIADRLRINIAKHDIIFEKKLVRVTISIGLSELKKDERQIEPLTKRADTALYEAKESGRNKVCIA